jgi:CYTH domain-containing protein
MAREIERKFLVDGDAWRAGAKGAHFRQGYLSSKPDRTVRVRSDGVKGHLTVKGKTEGASRDEYEYEIPLAEATAMLDRLCERPLIEKTRYTIPFAGFSWEIDEFGGDNHGLIIAEVELTSEGQMIALPPWAGREVTGDPRYYNSNLAQRPYRSW